MYSNKYELNVLVGDKPVREYFHQNKFFVEAKRGTEYTLKLKNHGPKRIMAVFSVDGVDVLKGKSAAEAESGYIVNAFSSLTVKGFRVDDTSVAAFKFDETGNSYASLVEAEGDVEKAKQYPSKNNGIIGVRIWEEKETKLVPDWGHKVKKNFYEEPAWYPPYTLGGSLSSGISGYSGSSGAKTAGLSGYSGSKGASGIPGIKNRTVYSANALFTGPTPDMGNNPQSCYGTSVTDWCSFSESNEKERSIVSTPTPNFTVGTAWGKQIEDKVVKVNFEKSDTYIDLEIFYLERAELINYGVDVDNAKKIFASGFPKAFGAKEEYCKIPTNWRKA